eukprot:12414996-Karenia_brevis.AAC.1
MTTEAHATRRAGTSILEPANSDTEKGSVSVFRWSLLPNTDTKNSATASSNCHERARRCYLHAKKLLRTGVLETTAWTTYWGGRRRGAQSAPPMPASL